MNHEEEQSVPCEACQRRIKFIVMKKSGKLMPVDATLVIAREDLRGSYVTAGGVMKNGLRKGETGYVPHWATCNTPGRFRARRVV